MILFAEVCALRAEISLVIGEMSIIMLAIKFSTNLRAPDGLRKDRAGDGNFMASGDGEGGGFLRSPAGEGVQDDQAEKEHR